MQILTIWTGFEAFDCKFYSYERDSKHSNANSNHSKGIRSIRIQIRTIRKGYKTFECKNLNIRSEFEVFESKFKPL